MQYQAAISTRTLLYNHIQKTWKILIENIAGDHYWLNKEQWNYLWKQFQMTGLPMYLIMDKQGNIVKRFTHITAKELKNYWNKKSIKYKSYKHSPKAKLHLKKFKLKVT